MAATSEGRPNIRIEIKNNLVEQMEVDSEKAADSDFEDGEISDMNDTVEEVKPVSIPTTNRAWPNAFGGFTTGVDIFNKKEQGKLFERASRFGLKPGEFSNFTDKHLQQLYESLGITAENEKNIRFEAIHMRGTDEMSTGDVFEYFGKYGPAQIEWITDESCNVVWNDKTSAARAMHFTSKAVSGMPVGGPCDPFTKDAGDKKMNDSYEEKGRSILLKNREVSFQKEEDTGDNAVNLSDINSLVPPGYWRLGTEQPKKKSILLRFTYKTDKKPVKAERFSEYYKKHGNPNFGGMKGLISESRRRQFKGIFERNKNIGKMEKSKNPWGDLAENWNLDERFAERVPPYSLQIDLTGNDDDSCVEKPAIVKRLGVKRRRVSTASENGQENVVVKKSKVPRMRMYADEEEERIRRKQQLSRLKLSQNVLKEDQNRVQDLRKLILGVPKVMEIHEYEEPTEDADLGKRLKNRTRVEAELRRPRTMHADEERARIAEKPRLERRPLSESKARRHSSRVKPSRREYDESRYRNKLHSDRYERDRRRRSSRPHNEYDSRKPKSKVAVVIKTQKEPAVASTIWSRIAPKERLKTASERHRTRVESSSSSEESSDSNSSSSSSSSDSSESSSDSEEESEHEEQPARTVPQRQLLRPGFHSTAQSAGPKIKSPLRIEINNDHFKEE